MPDRNHDYAAIALSCLTRCERIIATGAFVLMVVVSFTDVALREITGQGLDGAREAAVLLMVVLVMSGFGLATAAGRQLRPRFLDGLIPDAWTPTVQRIGDLLSALIFAILAVLGAILVAQSLQLSELTPVLRLPSALIQLVLPAAFLVAVVRHLVFFLRPDLRPTGDIREMVERGPTAS